jgi:hypothetical protein
MKNILFDNSIPHLVNVLRKEIGDDAIKKGVILRDATGRLSFFSNDKAPTEEKRVHISKVLVDVLGPYIRDDRAIAYKNDPGAKQILEDPLRLPLSVGDISCQLVDRRIVGSGWLDSPIGQVEGPPRIVFASLKGGVGRSTALAVAAADFARHNRNVLVIDLDLEAPGVGDFLLEGDRLPKLGVADYLVENGIGGVADKMLDDFIGISELTTGGGGRVQVVPALGSSAVSNPENVLPKISRAMIEDVSIGNETVSVSKQISIMIEQLSNHTHPDVVLIDSRAGLSELAAPALLGLGATILLFGTAQLQTINGYRALFAGLKLLANRERASGGDAEWRLKIKAVHAKASLNETILERHRDDLYDLFSEIYDKDRGTDASPNDISFDIDDNEAPHWPLLIPFNQSFADFDPVQNQSQLTEVFYEQTFRPFLNDLDAILEQ